MRLKKKLGLLGAVCVLASVTSAVFASQFTSIFTTNNTPQFSTVIANGKCAGAKGRYTHPGDQRKETKKLEVIGVCGTAPKCEAHIIVSDTEDQVKQCAGKQIGLAVLTMSDLKITASSDDPVHYPVVAVDNELTISYRK